MGPLFGNTESTIDEDLAALESGGIDGLLTKLRSGAVVCESNRNTLPVGSKCLLYPVLYMLTRYGWSARWGRESSLRPTCWANEQAGGSSHLPKAQL